MARIISRLIPASRPMVSLRRLYQKTFCSALKTPTATVIAFPSTTSKDQLFNILNSNLPPLSTTASTSAILLFSKPLTPYFTDPSFLPSLFPSSQNLTLLAAAVDSIPYSKHDTKALSPTDGISLLHSTGTTCPLFRSETPTTTASLDFHLPPLGSHLTNITLPLANTVFQNGRPHTMFTTTWSDGRVVPSAEESRVAVDLTFLQEGSSKVVFPMVPITGRRRIMSGLGNILKTVERDGQEEPASRELEEVIPKILKEGRGQGGTSVWAIIWAEGAEGRRIGERGAQVRRVLSGGGGWGAKQGLLSLDPETEVGLREEEEVENFARAFRGEEGVVRRGSWVQFVVEPWEEREVESEGGGIVLGAQGDTVEGLEEVKVQEGVFGGMSTQGIYVSSKGEGITTRIDMPGSYVMSGF